MRYYEHCTLCPRMCGVNRKTARGFCGQSDKLYAAKAYLHKWEEPCISGQRGSGTVFFTGCSLGCVYCQNREISVLKKGYETDIHRLSDIFLELQSKGAENINLVTPTHYVRHIIHALDIVRGKLTIPVVYNCGGYERAETLKSLDGYIDIYMPDLKYIDSESAKRYSKAEDYPQIVKRAIDEMVRQTVRCVFDERGVMKRGVIVRHLILPSLKDRAKDIIKYLYETYGDSIYMSIMNQYTPLEQVKEYPELCRKISDEEYDEVLDLAVSIGVENAFIQEGGTVSESFIPRFDGEGIIRGRQ